MSVDLTCPHCSKPIHEKTWSTVGGKLSGTADAPRKPVPCPHCGEPIAAELWMQRGGALANSARKSFNGAEKVKKPCPFCKKEFGARDLRRHKAKCLEARQCPVCMRKMSKSEFAGHPKECRGPGAKKKSAWLKPTVSAQEKQ